jgi:ATP-binding protein involved in chromosome partitioning
MTDHHSSDRAVENAEIEKRFENIRHTIIVLSGKGGVGKSFIASNLAISLSLSGYDVGLLDVDFHGPSIPKLLGLENRQVTTDADGLVPLQFASKLKVMSLGMLLRSKDDAVIWRGPLKMGAIKQLLKDVNWGELDFFIVDCPPGTGDEPLSVVQLIKKSTGAVVVTTPQDLSISDVRRSIRFCNEVGLPVLGVIENMSGFVCPRCGESIDIFKSGGGERMAEELGVNFLGRLPVEVDIVKSSDDGLPYVYHYGKTETAKKFEDIVHNLLKQIGDIPVGDMPVSETPARDMPVGDTPEVNESEEESSKMPHSICRYAIPTENGELSSHFGHCQHFAIVDYDVDDGSISRSEFKAPPAHEPGLLPKWLHEQGVNVILAAGMGMRAKDLFAAKGITVVIGAPIEKPENLVMAHARGELASGENPCDH